MMKKSFKKFLMHSLSVCLSAVMFANFSINAVFAEEKVKVECVTVAEEYSTTKNAPSNGKLLSVKTEKQYVKDVKFITGDSLEDAKKNVPKGYLLVENDLNQGAELISSVDDVYLAYTTTTNPDEAITDIKMMNMKGGYVVSDYDTEINNVSKRIQDMVREFGDAVDSFRENYKKGTPGAKAAYCTLSAFTIDELDNKSLADYLVYSQVPDGFYLKLLMNAHMDILSSILSALTMAVQGEAGNTWLDRLAKIEDPYGVTNTLYWDQAVALLPHFESFFETYDSINHYLYRGPGGPLYKSPDEDGNKGEDFSDNGNNPSVDLTGGEFLYELAYSTLEQYTFGNGSLISEWLVCDWIYEEMLYPLVEVLTPAEYAMMHLCGPLYMIFATAMSEGVYKDYIQKTNELSKEMGGKCSVWTGVNTDLLRSSIAITDQAMQAIYETKAGQEFNEQGDSGMNAMLYTAGAFAAVGLVSLGAGMLTTMVFGSSIFAGLLGSAAVAFTCKAAVIASIAGVVCASAGVVGIAVALVVAVVYLVVWIADWIAGFYPELSKIPEYMYDYVIDGSDNGQFLLYEAAKDQNGKAVDVNAFDGKEWHAPYISRDKAAGAPIEADFIVRTGDGRLDEGYGALSAFGNVNCENLNRYAFDDDVDGIFVSYRQEDLTGDFARGKYLADAKLFTAEDEEHCKLKLKNEKYVLYNVNLTPDADYCTYLGYKTTNKTANALTDIRFAYGYNSTQYSAGGGTLTYAESGTAGDLTLYKTRVSAFGSPITSDFTVVNDRADAPVGYEPVNLFSGGSAVNLNVGGLKYINENKPYYLYFLPSKAYVSGTEYIGGLAMMYDVSWEGYFNDVESISSAAVDMEYDMLATMKGSCAGSDGIKEVEGAILFTTTYNPYRAIYGIGSMTTGGEMGKYFSETITYDGKGYTLATRYVVDHNDRVLFDSNIRSKDARLYVAGPGYGDTPLKPGDVLGFSVIPEKAPTGYRAINSFLSNSEKPVNITSGLNYSYQYGYSAGKTMNMAMSPFYMYVRGNAYQEGKYLTSVYITSKEKVLDGENISCDALDASYLMNNLAIIGAHTVINKNLNLEDSDNTTYIGYTKDPSVRDPITDMFLYYAGETDKEPDAEYVKNNVKYQLVSDVNIFCEEDYVTKTCKRVYLYATTNPAAGSSILDIKIDNNAIIDGWQTVRTQNGKALYDDMDEHSGNMWFIHMKRANEEPKYVSEIVVGWGNDAEAKAMLLAAGCDYMLTKDLNYGVGAHSDYVYLGYKRTSDPNKAIRNIIAVHDEDYASFIKDGATYYKIEGNLNSYTNVFADDIYLFYTKDASAGNPITSLGTSQSIANWSHGEGNRYVVKTVLNQHGQASDLNDGALGDYIYLLQTRDKSDQGSIASMIGKGSIFVIIAFAVLSIGVVIGLFIMKKKRGNKSKDQQDNNE